MSSTRSSPMSNEPIVINFGSDSFEGTDLDRILRANNIGHLFVSGQCIEHVVATTIKRAANMGYNAILIKDATSGFTDSNYSAMLDILPLYAKVITANEFTLDAPYGGRPRDTAFLASRSSFSGRMAGSAERCSLRRSYERDFRRAPKRRPNCIDLWQRGFRGAGGGRVS